MNKMKELLLFSAVAAVVPGLALAASDSPDEATGYYEQTDKSIPIEDAPEIIDQSVLVESTAEVVAVDHTSRDVTIEGADGRLITVRASDKVKNLDQVEVGDKIFMKYYLGAAVDVIRPGDGTTKPSSEVTQGVVTAAPGEKPAALGARQVRRTAEILWVDPYKKTISFRGPNKGYRTIRVKDTHLEHYLKELKEGDIVEVVYTESMAVFVEEVE